MTNILKTVTLETIIDKHIRKPGTERRDSFENQLRIDLLSDETNNKIQLQADKDYGTGATLCRVVDCSELEGIK